VTEPEDRAESAFAPTLSSVSYILVVSMSLFLVVTEAARTAVVSLVFGVDVIFPGVVVGLVGLFVYSHDRIYYDTEDIYNSPQRVAFVNRYRRVLCLSLFVIFAVVEYVMARSLAFVPFLLVQAPFVVVGVYDTLKRFVLVDTLAVSFSQALLITVFPLAVSDVSVEWATAVLAFTFIFLRGVCAVQLNNIDDRVGDVRANKDTLTSMLSLTQVKGLVAALYLCSLAVLLLLIPLSLPVALSYLVTFSLVAVLTTATANRIYIINSFTILILLGHFWV
jgi:hypothetical protein